LPIAGESWKAQTLKNMTKEKLIMNYRLSLPLLLFLFFSNCSNASPLNNSIIDKNKSICIIFLNPPAFDTVRPFKGFSIMNGYSQITIWDKFHRYDFSLNSSKEDTITFVPQGNEILLTYSISTATSFDYLIENGDTVIFTNEKGYPNASIYRESKNKKMNYELDWYLLNTTRTKYTPSELYKLPVLTAKNLNDVFNSDIVKREYYPQAKKFLQQEAGYYDSLYSIKTITASQYGFLKNKIENELYHIDYEQNNLEDKVLDSLMSINKLYNPNTGFPFSYFHPLIYDYIRKTIENKTKVLHFSTGKIPDFREVYDKINNLDNLSMAFKESLLYDYLKQIGTYFSTDDLKLYYKKFSHFSSDTFYLNSIQRKFRLDDTGYVQNTKSLYLINKDGSTISLEKLLHDYKGYIIYIDFWASWCAPCRASMPYSGQLRDLYKNTKVVFVYMSIDKDADKWLEASKVEKLDTIKTNYLIVNKDNSIFLKQINLQSIPRYLLIDKNGNIIYKNAPDPKSPEIKKVISKYLL
jgi:thiol-disulfide isomerase/thioredoxin